MMINRRFLKTFFVLALVAMTVFNLSLPAGAAPLGPSSSNVRTAKLYVGQNYYVVNGVRSSMDAAPYIKNGRTLIPLRYMGYALGLGESDVAWNQDRQTVTLTRGKVVVVFTVGSTNWTINTYTGVSLDVSPENVNGRVMVPFRAAAQALGGMCFWNPNESSVTMETWASLPDPMPSMDSLKIYSVKVNRSTAEANVTKANTSGTWTPADASQVTLDRPVYISNSNGWSLDAVEWFKAWGVPDSDMIFDPALGGLLVRGAFCGDGDQAQPAGSNFGYLYAGDKNGYDGLGSTINSNSSSEAYVSNGALLADWSAAYMPSFLWRKVYSVDASSTDFLVASLGKAATSQAPVAIQPGATLDDLPVWSDADLNTLGLQPIPFISQWLGPEHPNWGIVYPVAVMGYNDGSKQVTCWNYAVTSPQYDQNSPAILDKSDLRNQIIGATQYNKKWTETLETPPAYKAGDGNDAYDVMTVLEAFGVPKSAMLWDAKSQVLTVRAVQNSWGVFSCAPFVRYIQIEVGDSRYREVQSDGTVWISPSSASGFAPYMLNGRLVWEDGHLLAIFSELYSDHQEHETSASPQTWYDNLNVLML